MTTETPRFEAIHGDCLEILPRLPSNSVDLIMTSPPYAERRKDQYGGIAADDYSEWFLPRAEEMKRALKPTGSFVLNIWEHCEGGTRHPYVLRLVLDMIEAGWLWIEEYIWRKLNPIPGGHKLRLRDAWEHLYHFAKSTDIKIYQDAVAKPAKWQPSDIKRQRTSWGSKNGSGLQMGHRKKRLANEVPRSSNGSGFTGDSGTHGKRKYPVGDKRGEASNNGSGLRMGPRRVRNNGSNFGTSDHDGFDFENATAHNVIETTVGGVNTPHPGTFPRKLPEFFIKLFTEPGDLVLDPFVGSGTTMYEAYALRRHSIGIDAKAEYIERIHARPINRPLL